MSNVDEDRVFTHEQGENLLTRQEQIRNELAGIRNTLNKHFGVEPALMLDGTPSKYYAGMQLFFEENLPDNPTKEQITAVTDLWFEKTRLPWDGYVDFYNPDLSAVATGTKGGDNAGMTAVCSTNSTAGQDDYAGLPLFAPRDCNFEMDPETLEPVITAIDGIYGNFERYNPDKMVGVLQQSGYVYVMNDASRFRLGYTAKFVPYTYIWPLHESVRPSNSKMRPWVIHSKYLNKTVNGKLTSYSGPIPTAYSISHNTLHTLAAATGTGWSGMCYCDWNFLWIMFMIKYASLSADGILQGCLSNNYTSKAAAGETGVKRILLSSNPGYEVGMGVLVGEVNASNNVDRGSASCYNISTNAGCKSTAPVTLLSMWTRTARLTQRLTLHVLPRSTGRMEAVITFSAMTVRPVTRQAASTQPNCKALSIALVRMKYWQMLLPNTTKTAVTTIRCNCTLRNGRHIRLPMLRRTTKHPAWKLTNPAHLHGTTSNTRPWAGAAC